ALNFVCNRLRLVDSGIHFNLSASIYLCLAELCSTLRLHCLTELPKFMPDVLQTYESNAVMRHELLLTSVISCLSKLVRTLCDFLTPYLLEIIKRTCNLLTQPALVLASGTNQNELRLRTMWTYIANFVPHRLLFPTLHDFIEQDKFVLNDIEPLMTLLKQSIAVASVEDLNINFQLLKNLFLKLFTLRTIHTKQIHPNKMNDYEDHVFDCFSELVMRLSEESFRPLFFTIYEWAVYNEPPREHSVTFYRLTLVLAKKLKSLFSLFAGHIIQHAATTLDLLNLSKNEKQDQKYFSDNKFADDNAIELINGILGTISNICLFDSVGFINNERFQLLMSPVVDQLEQHVPTTVDYQQWIERHVSPCIVNLTAASKEEPLWRRLHYQLLLKTKSDSSQIRLATLHILQELSRKLSVNYQSLLAEAVPYLAELMEDSNEKVENACHRVIVDMESTLGESLQQYFNA
ncbi:unnamed protein product, partial [Didymodactylos carnosus]